MTVAIAGLWSVTCACSCSDNYSDYDIYALLTLKMGQNGRLSLPWLDPQGARPEGPQPSAGGLLTSRSLSHKENLGFEMPPNAVSLSISIKNVALQAISMSTLACWDKGSRASAPPIPSRLTAGGWRQFRHNPREALPWAMARAEPKSPWHDSPNRQDYCAGLYEFGV